MEGGRWPKPKEVEHSKETELQAPISGLVETNSSAPSRKGTPQGRGQQCHTSLKQWQSKHTQTKKLAQMSKRRVGGWGCVSIDKECVSIGKVLAKHTEKLWVQSPALRKTGQGDRCCNPHTQ